MEKVLPVKHLSARVPWHDNRWNGRTCCNVLDNSFCRILPSIDQRKKPEEESQDQSIGEHNMPPCVSEKGLFMSPADFTRPLRHAWTDINPMFHDYLPATYHHKPYSINAVPFLWLMKEKAKNAQPHFSEKAFTYELDYKPELEDAVDQSLGFEGNIWVQHPHNQQVLLDAFFDCLKPRQSLIFFYSKHTPLSEPNERVIVGVAKVRNPVGPILHYEFPAGFKGHRGHPWDRCIQHTLTPELGDGLLLPYHDILEYVEQSGSDVDLRDYAAFAPDFAQYSYASELVEHDTAIDSLLLIAESLRKSAALLGRSFEQELNWVDAEISRIWDMRGAFPGMGPVLSAIGIENGNSIAWEIEKYILDKDGDLFQTHPWEVLEQALEQPDAFFNSSRALDLFNATARRIWKSAPAKKKAFYQLLSRCQLNNYQAEYLVEKAPALFGSLENVLENLYLIYEKTLLTEVGITFRQVDKALLPPQEFAEKFPPPEAARLTDKLDERRARALCIWMLEEAAAEGHTLLPFDDILQRIGEKSLENSSSFPVNEDILMAYAESAFFQEEINLTEPGKTNKTPFLKLSRLVSVRDVIRRKLNFDRIKNQPYPIEKNWLETVNKSEAFKDIPLDLNAPDYETELLARCEKAEALRVMTQYRFSVLIGPAGSGKTTLLKILESLPEFKGNLIKLAPTGKARVKMGSDGKTVAQFLFPHRYHGLTGRYFINEEAPRVSAAKNIIIDEASMLTEEQLAAIFDSLGAMERIILVGDYRQLPPIGTGRPFADIIQMLKPEAFDDPEVRCGPAFAELKQIRRQVASPDDQRWDVALSQCFSDEPAEDSFDVFRQLAAGQIKSDHIRLEKWYASQDFQELFKGLLKEELGLEGADEAKAFNRTLGARDSGDYQYFNYDYSERVIESWQILSPVNGMGYGVKEINKYVQNAYRRNFIDLALNAKAENAQYSYARKIAKPKGNDGIVYGDKVINLKNINWREKDHIVPFAKKKEALNYIANGEIGVVTGEWRKKGDSSKKEPNVHVAFSTQPGYEYVFWANAFDENDNKYALELAYAITVHKAQGSGFKKVFFVLPARGRILSRELLYTALTRQEDKIIILHQGEFRDFLRLASTENSATAERYTDLFSLPELRTYKNRWYDVNYVNISERGEPMISKSEVIIANCLNKYKREITYAYEDKLRLEVEERTVKPDFTIEHLDTGRIFYWEHLGMMAQKNYREKWLKKLEGYRNDGFVLHTEAGPTDDKVLIITEDNPNGGIDSKYIDDLVGQIILED